MVELRKEENAQASQASARNRCFRRMARTVTTYVTLPTIQVCEEVRLPPET
jgi:hypothetical protein